MANWKDVKNSENNDSFYPGTVFVDMKALIGKEITICDVTPFENEKGPGVAALFYSDIEPEGCKLVTHSIGVCKTLASEEFIAALAEHKELTVTVKEGQSKKSGKYFYYVD